MSGISIYFKKESEYYFVPTTSTIGFKNSHSELDTYIKVVENSNETICRAFFGAKDIAVSAKQVNINDKVEELLWRKIGVKSFKKFVEQFDLILVDILETGFSFKTFMVKNGDYYRYNDFPKAGIPLDSSPELIGETIKYLFGEIEKSKNEKLTSFESYYSGNKVEYLRPSKVFYDLDDASSPAYQVYGFEGELHAYITFWIDPQYDEVTAECIKKKWRTWDKDLSEFNYRESGKKGKLIGIAEGKTPHSERYSYFYRDNDAILEVMVELDSEKLTKPQYTKAKKELLKIVKSVEIKK